MEGLTKVKGLRVPNDLYGGSDEECNIYEVWRLPKHTPLGKDSDEEECVGSGGLVYNSEVTEGPNGWTGNCRVCGR